MDEFIPKDYFYLQWHITNCCNLRCKHCYQTDYNPKDEFTFIELVQAFIQFKDLIDFFNADIEKPEQIVAPQLTFTGGEPFVRGDFFDLLEIVCSNIPTIQIGILTNGTLITEDIAKRLKNLGIERIQISIDGDENLHDSIRGKGSFQKALRGLHFLNNEGIYTAVSFTAHKNNYKVFPIAAKIAKENGARLIWSDRLIPNGSGAKLLIFNKEQTAQYIDILAKTKDELETNPEEFEVSLNRSLQFTAANDKPYCCVAGNNALTLMENGDVYPCRRMPIMLGNIRTSSLKDIYCTSKILKDIRKPFIPHGCQNCEHAKTCKGGLKCLSYAVNNDYDTPDPGCRFAQ